MKYIKLFFSTLIILSLFSCCKKESKSNIPNEENQSTINTTLESLPTKNNNDILEKTKFHNQININLSENKVWISNKFTPISISETPVEIIHDSKGTISISKSNGVIINASTSTNTKLRLTGSLDGTLQIISSDKAYNCFAIELNNVDIKATDGPAIDIPSKNRTFIIIPDKTTNLLKDSQIRNSNFHKGAIYSKGPLIFTGSKNKNKSGTLTLSGEFEHGIYSKNYIRFCNGTYNLNCSARNVIQANNRIIVDGGTLNIKGTGTKEGKESKGIVVTGKEDINEKYGDIVINNGNLHITTVGKGISAKFDRFKDSKTEDTNDDPNPIVTINGGNIRINSGVEFLSNDDEAPENLAFIYKGKCISEGIEGKNGVIINGGNIEITSKDDCINVAKRKELIINGGKLYAHSLKNDALDSNGSITINGGIVVATATTIPECAFDCGFSPFRINGGTVVGIGTKNWTKPHSTSSQNVIAIKNPNYTKSGTFALLDEKSKPVFAYNIPEDYRTIIFSSPEIKAETNYTFYNEVQIIPSKKLKEFNGLYYGKIKIKERTKNQQITTSKGITLISK